MLKNVAGIIVVAATANLNAETLSFPSFQMETQDGWVHSIENGSANDWGSVISLRHPDGAGLIKLRSYNAPAVVSEDVLRNMTNVEPSRPLAWQNWGGFSGYHYSYSEGDSYFRQWWLAHDRTILIVTYQCDLGSQDIETAAIDKMIRSIEVQRLQER